MIETRIRNNHPVYRVRVRVCKQDYSQTFDKEADAKKWEAKMTFEAYQKRYLKQKANGMLLMSTLIDKHIAENAPSSITIGQLKWWKNKIGMTPVDNVDAALISECKQALLIEPYYRKKTALTRSNSTVNRYLAAISVVFSYACCDWDLIPVNPCSKVRKLKEPAGRIRYLSPDELKRLFQVVNRMQHPILGIVLTLAIYTGARKMEIMNLRWSDVDTTEKCLIFRHTKNGEVRSAKLVQTPWEILMAYCQSQNPKSLSDYLFPSENGKKPFYIRKSFNEALKRAGIFDFRFHDLRHTTATYLIKTGASTTAVADLLGHKTLAMVKRYAHIMPDHRRECLEKMEKTYCDIIPISAERKGLPINDNMHNLALISSS